MKVCPVCGAQMDAKRSYCSVACSNKGRQTLGRKHTRTLDGGITFWCPQCKDYKPKAQFHIQKGRRASSWCRACRSIERKARYLKEKARVATIPPPEVVAVPEPVAWKPPGSFHFKVPEKNIVLVPMEKLRYEAEPCHVYDGYALAMELHRSRVADPWVRGWFSSVSEDAQDYVRPRFETERQAKLWNEFIAHRVGVRR